MSYKATFFILLLLLSSCSSTIHLNNPKTIERNISSVYEDYDSIVTEMVTQVRNGNFDLSNLADQFRDETSSNSLFWKYAFEYRTDDILLIELFSRTFDAQTKHNLVVYLDEIPKHIKVKILEGLTDKRVLFGILFDYNPTPYKETKMGRIHEDLLKSALRQSNNKQFIDLEEIIQISFRNETFRSKGFSTQALNLIIDVLRDGSDQFAPENVQRLLNVLYTRIDQIKTPALIKRLTALNLGSKFPRFKDSSFRFLNLSLLIKSNPELFSPEFIADTKERFPWIFEPIKDVSKKENFYDDFVELMLNKEGKLVVSEEFLGIFPEVKLKLSELDTFGQRTALDGPEFYKKLVEGMPFKKLANKKAFYNYLVENNFNTPFFHMRMEHASMLLGEIKRSGVFKGSTSVIDSIGNCFEAIKVFLRSQG